MRPLPCAAVALAALSLGAATADAQPVRATFNVSLYGIQRYEDSFTRIQMPSYNAFDQRGTITQHGVVRFHTARPRRATLVGDASYVDIRWAGDGDGPDLPVIADFANSGETKMENATGIVAGGEQWAPVPPPDTSSCTAHTDHLGFDLSLSRRAQATSSSSLVVPIGNPLEQCPYGDRSLSIDSAAGPSHLRDILTGEKTEIVLRHKDGSHSKSDTQTYDMKKRTTVYVVFKRVG